jgi:Holliday junction resolvase RusA-like endonuclease
MKMFVPVRNEIVAQIPVFATINPLRRPRASWHAKGRLHSDLKNQAELFESLRDTAPLGIDYPVFLDVIINWTHSQSVSGPKRPLQATKKNKGDLDNLAKAISDALVKFKVLADDIHVVGQQIVKAYGHDDMATIVIWSVQPLCTEITSWHSSPVPTNSMPSEQPLLTLLKD